MFAQSIADLDFERVQTQLGGYTRTSLGRRLTAPLQHYAGRDRVVQEMTLTTQMRSLLEAGHKPPFGGTTDVAPLLEHAVKQGILEAEDLIQAADTVRGIWLLTKFFRTHLDLAPLLAELATGLPDLGELHQLLYDTFDKDGNIVDNASRELADLRKKRRTLHDRIRARIHAMLGNIVIQEHLQDTYYTIREDRYVLPVMASDKKSISGIIHGSSQTGQTLFVEPEELVSINNELKLCEQAVIIEERRILADRTMALAVHREAIEAGQTVIGELDLVFSRARLSMAMSAHPPELSADTKIHLKNVRNPLLLLRNIDVVPNDIDVGDTWRMLILTGANAGGKTVTLNTLGLVSLMVRAGLHIPADPESVFPVFENILTVFGDNQDLQADLSTFSGHLTRLQEMLRCAGDKSLVLLDEVVVGTEPEQGAALAVAVVEALVERGAVGIVTTHYKRLKTLSLHDTRFQNASVGFNVETHEPNYKIRLGSPGASSPIELAARMGLDDEILDRARELLGGQTITLERTLQRLEEERRSLDDQNQQLVAARGELETLTRKHRDAMAEIDAEGERLAREARADALEDVAQIKQELAEIVRSLQQNPTHATVQKRRSKVRQLEDRLKAPPTQGPPVEHDDDLPPMLPSVQAKPGAAVYVAAFDRDGQIDQIRGANAVVRVGNVHTTMSVANLRMARSAPQTKSERAIHPDPAPIELPPRAPDNTIDVRGHRVEEALDKVERFLDDALMNDRPVIYVLHGHGTGALKKGLRENFKNSPYVASFEAANRDGGGDGVTVVRLK